MVTADVSAFIEASECGEEARTVADKLIGFASNSPNEDEVLARCMMVFEYILHHAMSQVNGADLADFEVEVQTTQEKKCSE